MEWQEACLKSKSKRAKRITKNGGVIYREVDGSAVIKVRYCPYLREALASEIEGFLDWVSA